MSSQKLQQKDSKKKKKPKYNQNSQVRSALRRTFSRSPIVQEVIKNARSEHKKYKKDGSLAKKPAVRYTCTECKKLFMRKNIAVDHIDPVIPICGEFENWDLFIERLFCSISNLQVLCSYYIKDKDKHGGELSCHHKKTQEEKTLRKNYKNV